MHPEYYSTAKTEIYTDKYNHDHDTIYSLRTTPNKSTLWGLKNDVRRVLLFEQMVKSYEVGRMIPLHPTDAIMLSLFDSTRTIEQVESDTCYMFNISRESACSYVGSILRRFKEALCQTPISQVPTHTYRIADMIIPAHQVDLQTHKLYKPINMHFRLSDDCMRKCIYCSVEKRKKRKTADLSLSRWVDLVKECGELGVLGITLAGGDPFMNPNVVEIIDSIIRIGIHPLIATKSHVSRILAERLARTGIKLVQVSIDAGTEGLADLLTGSTGYFRGAMRSIRNLIAAGIRVRSNCVMTHINAMKADELVQLLLSMGVDDISLTGFARSHYVKSDLNEALLLDNADKDYLGQIADKYANNSVTFSGTGGDPSAKPMDERWSNFVARSRCSAGSSSLILHCDGKVTLCDEMPTEEFFVVGNVTTQSIMEVWNSPRISELVQPARAMFRNSPCYNCTIFARCHYEYGRCFRDAWKAYDDYFMPMPSCPLAPTGTRLD